MEEDIREIININIPNCVIYKDQKARAEDCIQKISTRMTGFIEWIRTDTTIVFNAKTDEQEFVVLAELESIYYNSDGIYQYWKENILKTQ